MGHDRRQRAVLLQPLGGGLGANLGHAGHVVHRITHQGLVVDHQVRWHAKFGLDPSHVAPAAVHGVDDGDAGVDQLRKIFIAAADGHLDALPSGNHGQGTDHVVSLHTRHVQNFPAHQPNHLVDGHNLGAQLIRHGRAVALVLGVNDIAKGRAVRVKHAGSIVRRHIFAQLLQHVDHAADGAGGRAGGVAGHGTQVRHGVKCSVQVA